MDRRAELCAAEGQAYGCLFCKTRKERAVAEQIERSEPRLRAVVARREKHMTIDGRKSRVEEVLLPGYVFFSVPDDLFPGREIFGENVIRVLGDVERNWRLSGEDARFARWLFRYDGLLRFSDAYCEGNRVRISSGPLKDLEGQIRRVDRRGRSAQVSLEFDNRTIAMWLGFELIDPLEVCLSDRRRDDI